MGRRGSAADEGLLIVLVLVLLVALASRQHLEDESEDDDEYDPRLPYSTSTTTSLVSVWVTGSTAIGL